MFALAEWLIYLASGFLAALLNAPIASARPPWRAHQCGDHSGAQKRPEARRRAQQPQAPPAASLLAARAATSARRSSGAAWS